MNAVTASDRQPGFLRVCGGYLAAISASALVVVAALWFHASTDEMVVAGFAYAFVCSYMFVCSLPGFIATVVVARLLALKTWFFFAIAGGLNGMLSPVFFNRPLLGDIFFVIVFVGSGLAGGLVYWLIAYRRRPIAA